MKQYTALAQIYDKMIDVDYNKWIRFIEDYFKTKEITIKGKNVLELGCGTGNMTILLRERGANITALDISEDMLSVAEEKARAKRCSIIFLKQDMVSFNISKKYDFIFSFCDGYNYITNNDDIVQSFKNTYNHLNNNGYFIFDISTPYKLREVIGSNTFTLNEDDLCYIWDNYIEEDTLEMYITFFVRQGDFYKRFDENHVQRIYEIDFIEKCLNDAGFKQIGVYNDYAFEKINTDSIRATFTAKKEE